MEILTIDQLYFKTLYFFFSFYILNSVIYMSKAIFLYQRAEVLIVYLVRRRSNYGNVKNMTAPLLKYTLE